MKIFHDFETYSEIDINKSGAYVYAVHPSTDIICLAFAFNNDEPFLWTPRDKENRWMQDLLFFVDCERNAEFHAWNALFEYYIWNFVGCRRYGWPKIPIERYRDTMALASSFGFPLSLGKAAEATGVTEQKEKRGEYLIRKLSVPRKPTKNNSNIRWPYEDAEQDYKDMYAYCIQDVKSERAIHNFLPKQALSDFEQKTWVHCQYMNNRGLLIDIDTTKKMISILEEFEQRGTQKLNELTNGEIETGGQRDKILEYCKFKGTELKDLTAKTVKDFLKNPPSGTNKDIIRILKLRKRLSRTSTKKYYKILDCISEDNRVRDFLVYWGAITGRYAGRNFQPHNLPRGSIKNHEFYVDLINKYGLDEIQMVYDDIAELSSSMIRSMIIAAPGCRFICSDYSTIENRGVAWMADDDVQLRIYRSEIDPYIDFAKDYYKIRPEDVNEAQRLFGKISILGLGYGMGPPRFIQTCEEWGVGISLEDAQSTVYFYREKYWKTVELWDKLNRAAMQCVIDKIQTRFNRIRFRYDLEHDFLCMILPSGREISYYKPEVRLVPTPWGEKKHGITYMGLDGYTRQWKRLHIIPGRLTENASSAICRDMIVGATHRAEAAGYPVVISVHDELICEMPDGIGSIEELNNIMLDIDRNAYPDFPVKVSGFETKRYKKG